MASSSEHEGLLLQLARDFHAEDGHPLSEQRRRRPDPGGARPSAGSGLADPARRGQIVGYAVLGLGFGIEYGGADAFVDDLYLVPEARGRGLGSVVLTLLEAQARELGLAALFLVVDPENTPALRLYRPPRASRARTGC